MVEFNIEANEDTMQQLTQQAKPFKPAGKNNNHG
jgi:hypothetical protein